jgi:hypothetical protein
MHCGEWKLRALGSCSTPVRQAGKVLTARWHPDRVGAAVRGQVRKLEAVPPQHVDVLPYKRREAGHVLVADVEAFCAQLVHRGIQVPGVEEDDGVEDQAEGADLVLAGLVGLTQDVQGLGDPP